MSLDVTLGKVDLVLTDPPYGMVYIGRSGTCLDGEATRAESGPNRDRRTLLRNRGESAPAEGTAVYVLTQPPPRGKERTEMCEPTCVLKKIERIRKLLIHFDEYGAEASMMARCLDTDLVMVIAQLEAAGEGQSWFQTDAALARHFAKKADLNIS